MPCWPLPAAFAPPAGSMMPLSALDYTCNTPGHSRASQGAALVQLQQQRSAKIGSLSTWAKGGICMRTS